jgi:hypothetical protein
MTDIGKAGIHPQIGKKLSMAIAPELKEKKTVLRQGQGIADWKVFL